MSGLGNPRVQPVVRLFGPLSMEDGSRVLGPRSLGGIRPKQVLEILLAGARGRAATGAEPPHSSRTAARATLAPDRNRHGKEHRMVITTGLVVRLEAKAGQAEALAEFLRGALPLVDDEPETIAAKLPRPG